MGNCLSDDAQIKGARYSAGGTNATESSRSVDAAEAQQATALLTGSAAYSTWVELRVACSKLRNADVMSKSDAMAVLYLRQEPSASAPGGRLQEVGRTEVVANTLNPTFVKAFKILYNFERVQDLLIKVVDIDAGQDPATVDPGRCDQLGEASFALSEVVTARDKALQRPLSKGVGSTVTVRAEQLSDAREVLTFTLAASRLKNVEVLSKSDPFLQIERLQDDVSGAWLPVFKTEVVPNNLNPVWRPITIRGAQLNNGDAHRPLRLKVLDYEASGRHRLLGWCDTSAVKLQQAAADPSAALPLNPLSSLPHGPQQAAVAAAAAPGAGSCGSLSVRSFSIATQPSFLDYIQSGIELSFMVAIDFTASNGDPHSPMSLHYINPSGAPSPYEAAINGVGHVLEFYDSDRMFPTFGFGGCLPPGPTSHCFALDPAHPEGACHGVAGIVGAYRQALSRWQLSGPTLFAPIIRQACAFASQPTPHLRYSCLLILTDGVINDMADTVEAIISASSLPLSILIVGVGGADFTSMQVLDADKQRLRSGGRTAERDIVQFVEFRQFAGNGTALAAELLAELPGQFLHYVRSRNIMPPAPPPPPPSAAAAGPMPGA